MMSLISSVMSTSGILAMGAPQGGGAEGSGGMPWAMLLQLGAMVVAFYFILIRPQQKAAKELRKQIDSLKVGDRILISGGIYGIISTIREKVLVVKIAENTKIEMLRSGVQQVVPHESKGDQKDAIKTEKK